MNKKNKSFPSELRLDLISNNWVVIATGRARKPEAFKREKRKSRENSKENCPFCRLSTQEAPVLILNKGKKIEAKMPQPWTTIVIPNKFPAFIPYSELKEEREGNLYEKINAAGYHEVVVTRDHQKTIGEFTLSEVKELFDAYQERYISLMAKNFVNHISIFHNQGEAAGTSVAHTHSQIVTTPLIDIDLQRALSNSENYCKNTGKCIYCSLIEWELKVKKRIVFENEGFVALCPFASKSAFQVIISPKKHLPYFEKANEKEKMQLAESFQATLRKIKKGLNDPDYNFYLHTAPCDDKDYHFYHWHWTILPKTSTWAGFELGSQMEISTIEPEKAASYLKKQ